MLLVRLPGEYRQYIQMAIPKRQKASVLRFCALPTLAHSQQGVLCQGKNRSRVLGPLKPPRLLVSVCP